MPADTRIETLSAPNLQSKANRSVNTISSRLILGLKIIHGILAMLALLFLCAGFYVWHFHIREEEGLWRYPSLRARVAEIDPELVSHFPESIPESATLKRFRYNPGFLQGSVLIQLRLGLTPQEIERLHSDFSKVRTKSFLGGNTNLHMSGEEGMPTTFFRTGEKGQTLFPDDFEIMVLDPPMTKAERRKRYGDNPQSHGVAISASRSEIIYWANGG